MNVFTLSSKSSLIENFADGKRAAVNIQKVAYNVDDVKRLSLVPLSPTVEYLT